MIVNVLSTVLVIDGLRNLTGQPVHLGSWQMELSSLDWPLFFIPIIILFVSTKNITNHSLSPQAW